MSGQVYFFCWLATDVLQRFCQWTSDQFVGDRVALLLPPTKGAAQSEWPKSIGKIASALMTRDPLLYIIL